MKEILTIQVIKSWKDDVEINDHGKLSNNHSFGTVHTYKYYYTVAIMA